MKNKATFSSMAAALGSRGGKVTKRKPAITGKLGVYSVAGVPS